jgi:molybdopterin molybdotransferase
MPLEEARELLLRYSRTTGTEYLNIEDAFNRILAEDLTANENIPPFDKSPLDGYAFSASDTETADESQPVQLRVVEEVPAGYMASRTVGAGTAIKIMTGAPIPEGADAVEKFERVERTDNDIKLFGSYRSGQNIIRAGEDVKKGQRIAERGDIISPPLTGLLASLGIGRIRAYKKPVVAIVSTGDALIGISDALRPGKIRNSNQYSLQSYCREAGARAVVIGTAGDRADEIEALVRRDWKGPIW